MKARMDPVRFTMLVGGGVAIVLVALVAAIFFVARTYSGPSRAASATAVAPTPAASPTADPAQVRVARDFVVALFSWNWQQPTPDVRLKALRPLVTDQFYGQLTRGEGSFWTHPGGIDGHQVDTVTIGSILPAGGGVYTVVTTVNSHADDGDIQEPHLVRVELTLFNGEWKVKRADP